jgi:thioredoxin-like negative regulator of GroEL
MLFKDGQPIATHVGSLSKAQLATFIEKHVPATAVTPALAGAAS